MRAQTGFFYFTPMGELTAIYPVATGQAAHVQV
jgi:hypothetical protein